MKEVSSDALGFVNKSLGLSGPGAQVTEFPDGILEQVYDVGALIRRGRTIAGSEGFFTAIMRNVHTDAETLVTTVEPYNIAAGNIAPYPVPIPDQFDLWLMTAHVIRVSGTGTIVAGLSAFFGAVRLGWGVDDSGVAVTDTQRHMLAFWDTLVAIQGSAFARGPDMGPMLRIGLRLPRSLVATQLLFETTSSATATFDCQLTLGLFPVGLGQDSLS